MTPERWHQIERLVHAALGRKASERAVFLADACAGDVDLRREVESLLAQESPAGEFLAEPALNGMARVIAASGQPAPARTLSPGAQLGPYRIIGLAGAGGMGEVYKAHDTRLNRTVAIKVLAADVSGDRQRRARFEREARAIAGLSHPHICSLHDVGEHEGSMYLVMEHLDGVTLADRLESGRLPLEQALTIATDIADALATAHRLGVVHRDLKPGNVMLTKAGAKLLDFGLAKLTGHGVPAMQPGSTQTASLTAEGSIVGTVQYMAPEQVQGAPADARTDL
jgi:serine/threonine protein kinase